MTIKENLNDVLSEIEKSRKNSITGEPVQLIAVSKMHSVEEIEEAIICGVTCIGENKVQELSEKIEKLEDKVNYHMIGQLQTNKVKYIYDKVDLIHSLDRDSLAKEINKRAEKDNIKVNCLVQVNIGREQSKGGLELNKVEDFIENCLKYKYIKIMGLMTVAPNIDDEVLLRKYFKEMYSLKEKIKQKNYDKDILEMKYLSMGMSQDFKLAIEEGSNMVRVGTNIFGKRNY